MVKVMKKLFKANTAEPMEYSQVKGDNEKRTAPIAAQAFVLTLFFVAIFSVSFECRSQVKV